PNGTGGRAMEELIDEGLVNAVLDMTPHEIVDELFHGVHPGGPHRLEVAGKRESPRLSFPVVSTLSSWAPFPP
ncbi:MAG: UPF0261 family protein, partial [Deltaproteobacteria bacterium]|nr:UPF0261 family protein [Deltaproteobacteria bacterium]